MSDEVGENSARARAYFHRIEETFVRLRGAPLLLSPADFQLARQWHEKGVPIDLVCTALEEVFARRRCRDVPDKVQGLRYCRHAVEAAWREVRDLSAVASRATAEPIDVEGRLARLAERLGSDLPQRQAWYERIRALSGAAEKVERELTALDEELLAVVWKKLDEARRRAVEEKIEQTLVSLSRRLGEEEVENLRQRLRRQELRRELALPILSLFSPEALEGEEPPLP